MDYQMLPKDPWLDRAEAAGNLTRSQYLIWLGQQIDPLLPLYNMAHLTHLHGTLDRTRFEAAFEQLLADSEALRSVFVLRDGVPERQVSADPPVSLEIVDVSAEADPGQAAANWARQRQRVPLKLHQSCFNSALLVLGSEHHVWFLNQHHIMTDAWSFQVLGQQLADRYAGRVVDALPSFSDYAKRERALREAPLMERVRSYWAQEVVQPAQPMDFYGSGARAQGVRARRHRLELGEGRTAGLKALAEQPQNRMINTELSQFRVFATLLMGFLARLSAPGRLALGSPVHNRASPQDKATDGLFIELFPLWASVAPDDSFQSLAERMGSSIMAWLSNARAGASTPVSNQAYDVVLNFLHARMPAFEGLRSSTQWLHPGFGDRGQQLRVQVHDLDGSNSWTVDFDCNSGVFQPAAEKLLLAQFTRWVDAVLADPALPFDALDLHDPVDRQRQLVAFNRAPVIHPEAPAQADCFMAALERITDQHVDQPALEFGSQQLTYGELRNASLRLASQLDAQGVKRGDLVALLLPRSPGAVIAMLAAWHLGAAYVPLDATHPTDRLRQVFGEILASGIPLAALLVEPGEEHAGVAEGIPRIALSGDLRAGHAEFSPVSAAPEDLAYVIFTSGSSGVPKGVAVQHAALGNYLHWAAAEYLHGRAPVAALHSALTVDLTITSLFLPLLVGGKVIVYEDKGATDLPILRVFSDDKVDLLKMTPAHLALLREAGGCARNVRTLILGGEALTTDLANAAFGLFGPKVKIYNEYGPSEATVGCMVHAFDPERDLRDLVPIGTPIANTQIYCLDDSLRPVATGLRGEIAIAGAGLAQGYLGQPALTAERFVDNPFNPGERIYRTGDAGRWSLDGELEFLGRLDQQVKIRGVRVELEDVATALGRCDDVREAMVVAAAPRALNAVQHCRRCGMPSNYPGVRFDQNQVCGLCRAWERYGAEASQFFGSAADLDNIIGKIREQADSKGTEIDALVLVSGGKDSTYMLHQLASRGLRLLALTLDNGFLSEQALENARRSTRDLGIELLTVRTEHMNAIFADSLSRHSNVCHGCFKTIYTLALKEAQARDVGAIFTGLSRGQIFETRLDDMFRARQFDVPTVEAAILDARKVYHRVDDAVGQLLDTSIFSDDQVFEDVSFIDFYRYIDVSLDEVYDYLDKRAPWVRPSDTGRSTNCLINDAGIFVHRRERGFHNYALPYSWDVRLGHKTREAAMHELDDEMDAERVRRILQEVGYVPGPARDEARLIAYYRASEPVDSGQLRRQLQQLLPAELIPAHFVHLRAFPVARNGKVDRDQLPVPEEGASSQAPFVAPSSATERHIAQLWSELLDHRQPGVHDDFFDLGGRSLNVIQVVARIRSDFGVRFPMEQFFEAPTIAAQAEAVEAELIRAIDALSDEEVATLLAQAET